MAQVNDLQVFINQIQSPAFFVKDGIVTVLNPAAAQRTVQSGTPITELLITGQEEYAVMTDGSLYLTITLSGTEYCCSVTKLTQGDLFIIDEAASQTDLQALALAAQQLRIPLSDMSSALDGMNNTDPERRAALNRSIHQLHRIIGNMSDTVRIVNGRCRPVSCDITALITEVTAKASWLLEQSGIHAKCHILNDTVYTLADPDLLTRAIYNLISNAVKFTEHGSTLDISLKRNGNRLYFAVENCGETISGGMLGSMFNRYTRRPGIEDPRFGIGLGMTLIQKAAAAHSGTVLVENIPGKGVRITMTISIRSSKDTVVFSPILKPDLYGGRDQALIELSDVLPPSMYK